MNIGRKQNGVSSDDDLVRINDTALNMFVKEIDSRTLLEMYNNFISHNKLKTNTYNVFY